MHLGLDAPRLRWPGVAVVPAQVGVDRGVLLGVAGEVGAVQGEAAEGLELALDEVQPARVRRQVDQLDVVLGAPVPQVPLVMRAEVVQDHDEVLVEAGSERAQQRADLAPGLPRPDVAVQPAGRRVVGGEQVADPGAPPIGRPKASRAR